MMESMKRMAAGRILYSPSDLIRFSESPFASWMDRLFLEDPSALQPDEASEDQKLIIALGEQHERTVLEEIRQEFPDLVCIDPASPEAARTQTLDALARRVPAIYQPYLDDEAFAGRADFLILNEDGRYQVWDAKLARSPKPYYAIQLSCYTDMLAGILQEPLAEKFGIILGTQERVEFRTEDFIYFYRQLRADFLAMQAQFDSALGSRPEPLPSADHGRWDSHAKAYFLETDHLTQVAGITSGQIKKLRAAGIETLAQLANVEGEKVPRMAEESLAKLAAQARLQHATKLKRLEQPDAPPEFEKMADETGKGLFNLPKRCAQDVFFDMEGYPLTPGGLEYLFGVWILDAEPPFLDWWAHDRASEKAAFEGFIDWAYARWKAHPDMHLYHYAAYEVSAVRRLSTRHATRQDEVDDLLRNRVFVDLYQTIRHSLRIGEDSYSIKRVERLYRQKRKTEVATAVDSIIQYSRWIESRQSPSWQESSILQDIRDYNEDDCKSTAELLDWLWSLRSPDDAPPDADPKPEETREPKEDRVRRAALAEDLRSKGDATAELMGELVNFHVREAKPVYWRMFDRDAATTEELRDDPACIADVTAAGEPVPEKKSFAQTYQFDPNQECKLSGEPTVMFQGLLNWKLSLIGLDAKAGKFQLKATQASLDKNNGGKFPEAGCLIPYEIVGTEPMEGCLEAAGLALMAGEMRPCIQALLHRIPAAPTMRLPGETLLEAGKRVATGMTGGCLLVQGPPGTGKTYTAARMITHLVASGKRVGIASNSHKAILNLMRECGRAMKEAGEEIQGVKAGGDAKDPIFDDYPGIKPAANGAASTTYKGGILGGTAWLFALGDMADQLDFLFIDEAGQVSMANAVAMARSTQNLVLLGDQMQLEQPIQGTHPGDSGLSVLQYALKDTKASLPDAPVFHAVVPENLGLFLGESRRMHPAVCEFISDSIYEGRLQSAADCALQTLQANAVGKEAGIVFVGVEHDGDVQRSDAEIQAAVGLFEKLAGIPYQDKTGKTQALTLDDFVFISPYNSQVAGLKAALPPGAKVGSVDKFQGQEAPICILSLCSSYGEYGSRGLGFILDRNRINVAISRAKCLAIVVGDPRIAHGPASGLEEMVLINLFCKIRSHGRSADFK